jgi:hypothetical protein
MFRLDLDGSRRIYEVEFEIGVVAKKKKAIEHILYRILRGYW